MPHNYECLKVCMVGRRFYPDFGGAERQAYRLALSLLKKDVSIFVVTERHDQGTKKNEIIDGVPVYRISQAWWTKRIKYVRRYLYLFWGIALFCFLWKRRRDFEILHVYFIDPYTYIAVLIGKILRKKIILKEGHAVVNKELWGRHWGGFLRSWIVKKADIFIGISNELLNRMKSIGAPKAKLRYIPNGIEVEGWPYLSNVKKERFRQLNQQNVKKALFCGRLQDKQKGVDILLRAWKIVVSKIPNAKLTILGDGREKAPLEQMTEDLKILDKVDFKGFVDNVQDFLSDTDIFVLPSRDEGMPNVLLEAMIVGVPCIGTSVGGTLDLIEHERTGFLVPTEDVGSLASAIISLFKDGLKAKRLGETAQQKVKTEFSMNSISDEYVTVYKELSNS